MKLNKEQEKAVYSRGHSVLVSAGAGSGKTQVLGFRVLTLLEENMSLSEMLILTFTNDAAYNMRKRIKRFITESNSLIIKENVNRLVNEVESADICTFDSFANKLVKNYGYLKGINPNFSIMPNVINLKLLEIIKNKIEYKIKENDPSFTSFLKDYYYFSFDDLSTLILSIINKENSANILTDTYKSCYLTKESIKEDYLKFYTHYQKLKLDEFKLLLDNLNSYYPQLDDIYTSKGSNEKIQYIKSFIDLLNKDRDVIFKYDSDNKEGNKDGITSSSIDDAINCIINRRDEVDLSIQSKQHDIFKGLRQSKDNPNEEVKELLKELRTYYDINSSYNSTNGENLFQVKRSKDEYLSDSELDRQLNAYKQIFSLVEDIRKEIDKFKTEHSIYTFTDIFNIALDLVESNAILRDKLKSQYKQIMVDEFQDNDDKQERLLSLIENNNLFLVGDVKQSIYLFRDANPNNFLRYYYNYEKSDYVLGSSHHYTNGERICMNKNYRSSDVVISRVNEVFKDLFTFDKGPIIYNEEHAMIADNSNLLLNSGNSIVPELSDIIICGKGDGDSESNGDGGSDGTSDGKKMETSSTTTIPSTSDSSDSDEDEEEETSSSSSLNIELESTDIDINKPTIKEMIATANSIKKRIESDELIYDQDLNTNRRLKYSDFAILTPDAKNFDDLEKVFTLLNIPTKIISETKVKKIDTYYVITNIIKLTYLLSKYKNIFESYLSTLGSDVDEGSIRPDLDGFDGNKDGSDPLDNSDPLSLLPTTTLLYDSILSELTKKENIFDYNDIKHAIYSLERSYIINEYDDVIFNIFKYKNIFSFDLVKKIMSSLQDQKRSFSDIIFEIFSKLEITSKFRTTLKPSTSYNVYTYFYNLLNDFKNLNLSKDEIYSLILMTLNSDNEDDEKIKFSSSLSDAVTIINIHKSKGLEYNIIYFLFFNKRSVMYTQSSNRISFNHFEEVRSNNNGDGTSSSSSNPSIVSIFDRLNLYLPFSTTFLASKRLSDYSCNLTGFKSIKEMLYTKYQRRFEEEEKIRLFYVALTRAKYDFKIVYSVESNNDPSKVPSLLNLYFESNKYVESESSDSDSTKDGDDSNNSNSNSNSSNDEEDSSSIKARLFKYEVADTRFRITSNKEESSSSSDNLESSILNYHDINKSDLEKMYGMNRNLTSSKKASKGITSLQSEYLSFGTKLHEYLEFIDFDKIDTSFIKEKRVKNLLDKFLTHPEFKSYLNSGNKFFPEYTYFDDEIGSYSAIDLLIVNNDNTEATIIDYKLKHVDDTAYIHQLSKYQNNVSKIFNIPLNKIKKKLYSLVDSTFKNVE